MPISMSSPQRTTQKRLEHYVNWLIFAFINLLMFFCLYFSFLLRSHLHSRSIFCGPVRNCVYLKLWLLLATEQKKSVHFVRRMVFGGYCVVVDFFTQSTKRSFGEKLQYLHRPWIWFEKLIHWSEHVCVSKSKKQNKTSRFVAHPIRSLSYVQFLCCCCCCCCCVCFSVFFIHIFAKTFTK